MSQSALIKRHDDTAQKISDKESDNILKTTVTTNMEQDDMDHMQDI